MLVVKLRHHMTVAVESVDRHAHLIGAWACCAIRMSIIDKLLFLEAVILFLLSVAFGYGSCSMNTVVSE